MCFNLSTEKMFYISPGVSFESEESLVRKAKTKQRKVRFWDTKMKKKRIVRMMKREVGEREKEIKKKER